MASLMFSRGGPYPSPRFLADIRVAMLLAGGDVDTKSLKFTASFVDTAAVDKDGTKAKALVADAPSTNPIFNFIVWCDRADRRAATAIIAICRLWWIFYLCGAGKRYNVPL